MDYEVQRCTRHCAASGRELREGEVFYSVLIHQDKEIARLDYAAEAWTGPPGEAVVAWWKSQVPERAAQRAQMAPSDVLLEYFRDLETRGDRPDVLYVLALLLIRRRVFRLEDQQEIAPGESWLTLYCPRDESTHRVRDAAPGEARISEIETELAELLYATAH